MRAIEIIITRPMPVPFMPAPVPAGFPSPADDFVEEEIDLQRLLIANRPATFLVRVAGDSMTGKQLHDGDLAVVDRSLSPRPGGVVVVDVDGERSFKLEPKRGHGGTASNVRCASPQLDVGRDHGVAAAGLRFTIRQTIRVV